MKTPPSFDYYFENSLKGPAECQKQEIRAMAERRCRRSTELTATPIVAQALDSSGRVIAEKEISSQFVNTAEIGALYQGLYEAKLVDHDGVPLKSFYIRYYKKQAYGSAFASTLSPLNAKFISENLKSLVAEQKKQKLCY